MKSLFRSINKKINFKLVLKAKVNASFKNFSAKKIIKTKGIEVPETLSEIIIDEDGTKIKNVKISTGIFPYFPLDDHPLIPGYSRMIPITREFLDKWNEIEQSKQLRSVISICKNPEKIEGLQHLSMYLNNVIY